MGEEEAHSHQKKSPKVDLCRKFTQNFAGPLTAYPMIHIGRLQARKPLTIAGQDVSQASYICFDDVLGGIGREAYSQKDLQQWNAPYREKLFLANGLQPPRRDTNTCNVL